MNQNDLVRAVRSSGLTPEDISRRSGGRVTVNNILSLLDGLKKLPEYKLRDIREALV